MFDLPRKVREFSCLCCGERFWTTQGEAKVVSLKEHSPAPEPVETISLDFQPTTHRN